MRHNRSFTQSLKFLVWFLNKFGLKDKILIDYGYAYFK